MSRLRPAATALLASAALLAACSADEEVPVSTESPATTPGEADTGVSSDGLTAGPESGQDAVAAIAAAEEEVAGSRAVELDREDGGSFEITVVGDDAAHDVTVSADGTEVTGTEEDDDVDADDRDELATATVTMVEAVQAAMTQEPGTVDEVELETEGDAVVWQVTMETGGGEQELRVDASTGDLLQD